VKKYIRNPTPTDNPISLTFTENTNHHHPQTHNNLQPFTTHKNQMRTSAQEVRAHAGHVTYRRERSIDEHDDECPSEAYEDSTCPSQYKNQNSNPYRVYWGGASCGPTPRAVGTNKQPDIWNNRGVGNESETNGVRVVYSLSPITIYRENSSPGKFLEAVETARGINKLGNEYIRVDFSDGTYEYRYNNQDGSFYRRHRDGSSDMYFPNGYRKHYPAPVPGEPARRKKNSRGEARSMSSVYREAGRNDTQQLLSSCQLHQEQDQGGTQPSSPTPTNYKPMCLPFSPSPGTAEAGSQPRIEIEPKVKGEPIDEGSKPGVVRDSSRILVNVAFNH
jgi:hypothetical protein